MMVNLMAMVAAALQILAWSTLTDFWHKRVTRRVSRARHVKCDEMRILLCSIPLALSL
jgi:hypothetical protein